VRPRAGVAAERPASGPGLPFALWLAVTVAALASRGLWVIDETRYASIAWDMWLRHDWLVPRLGGVPYSDKPPLLFWLLELGWAAAGVNAWWPRLVPALFALLAAFLTSRLAARLWPDRPLAREAAPLILLGTPFWALYGTVLLHDMPLVCAVLVAHLGLVAVAAWYTGGSQARLRRRAFGWLLFGAALGAGALAKGPVVLIHTLPAALLAPWWTASGTGAAGDSSARPWTRWYAGVVAAVLLGAVLALTWALPAAAAGGRAYADSILWSQTAGRVVSSMAHARPWWWYLPLVPLVLFPWALWPPLWRGFAPGPGSGLDAGTRFCVAWVGGGFLLLSAVSGKQPHYLLPLLPGCALLVARALSARGGLVNRRDALLAFGALALAGAAMAALPLLWAATASKAPPFWIPRVAPAWGLAAAAIACVLAISRPLYALGQARRLALAATAFTVLLQLGPVRRASPDYDVEPLAAHLATLERDGVPVAHLGRYDDQYQFTGRLRRVLEVIEPRDVAGWMERHPDGRVVTYYREWRADLATAAGAARPPVRAPLAGSGSRQANEPRPEFAQAYRGGAVAVWPAADVRRHPEVLERLPAQDTRPSWSARGT
jgi:4-amino-4-deoxy-L-arabinose transferase-like glycosyltransferase